MRENLRWMALLLLLMATTSACERGQTYAQALEIICNPALHLEGELPMDLGERQAAVAEMIEKRVTHEEARELTTSFSTMPPADRADVMRREVNRAGLSTCPMFGI